MILKKKTTKKPQNKQDQLSSRLFWLSLNHDNDADTGKKEIFYSSLMTPHFWAIVQKVFVVVCEAVLRQEEL